MIPKFRVWFSEASQMITDDLESINLFNETVTITSGYYDNFADVYDFVSIEVDIGNAILMQSTGLKDRNDVEIYEGDVLTLKYPRDRRYTVTAKVIRGSQVSAMTLRFEDEFTTEEIPLYKITAEHNLEVIGNIYKNPELLEVPE